MVTPEYDMYIPHPRFLPSSHAAAATPIRASRVPFATSHNPMISSGIAIIAQATIPEAKRVTVSVPSSSNVL